MAQRHKERKERQEGEVHLTGSLEQPVMTENAIAKIVVDAAFHIHRAVGPGLLESVYEVIVARDLARRGLIVARQQTVPIRYEDLEFEAGFRADLIVNDRVIVEVKCVDRVVAQHRMQLLTYLRMTEMRLGLLVNFSEPMFKNGLARVVNGLPDGDALALKNDTSLDECSSHDPLCVLCALGVFALFRRSLTTSNRTTYA